MTIILICILVFAHFSDIQAASIGQCTNLTVLTQQAALNITCLGAVDYSFFLPTGATFEYLNDIAYNQLSSASLTLLPTACQIFLKKAVCSRIYLKCTPMFDESKLQTYNYNIFSDIDLTQPFPIPFERPCLSACNDANENCLGWLNIFGSSLNCQERIDYSYGAYSLTYGTPPKYPYIYDQSNNTAICNSVPAVIQVASSKEPYIFAATEGACAGIISSLYVPAGNTISSSLSPMQQPYVVQSIIENKLAALFNAMPAWLSAECHLSLRKKFCGSSMLSPQLQLFQDVLHANGKNGTEIGQLKFTLESIGVDVMPFFASSFYLPSYPDNQVCQDYTTHCSSFIKTSDTASLIPKCENIIQGITQWPTVNRTIVQLPLPGIGIINFQTAPNSMKSSTDHNFQTVCPEGYVIPDNPSNKRNTIIPGSGCAFACERPVFTAEERLILDNIVIITPVVAMPMVIALILTWMLDKTRRSKGYLVLIYAINSFFTTFWFILIIIVRNTLTDPKSMFCLDNAIPLGQEDGPSLCVVQAVWMQISGTVGAFSWMTISLDLMFKVVFRWKVHNHFWFQMVFIFGVTLVLAAYVGAQDQYGYDGLGVYCQRKNGYDKQMMLNTFYYPILGATVIGTIGMISVVTEIILSSATSSGINASFFERLVKKVAVLKTSLLFVAVALIFWISIFIYRYYDHKYDEKSNTSFRDWVSCTFANFDDSEPQGWKKICGNTPAFRISFDFTSWIILATAGQSILVSAIYGSAVISSIFKVTTSIKQKFYTGSYRVHVSAKKDFQIATASSKKESVAVC